VLRWFSKEEGPARRAYRRYVKEGIDQGRRPDLVEGGLVRSMGGWSQVASMRKLGHKELSDERILGSGDFVNEVINEANKVLRYQFTGRALSEKIDQYIKELCQKEGVNIAELRSGSRRPKVSKLRRRLSTELVERYGAPLAEIARHVGVSTSAISKAIKRATED